MPKRLLVVSHPCVIAENQEVYAAPALQDWSLTLVAPARWRDPYRPESFPAVAIPDLKAAFRPLPILFAGYDQRHFYRARVGQFISRESPDIAFLEQEPFSLCALQWSAVLVRRRIPFGVQVAENLDRAMPAPLRVARAWILRHAAFVAARSPDAAVLARNWGARGRVDVVPHAVPAWHGVPARQHASALTVGFAGRLVEEKGLLDLVAAWRRMETPARLLIVGSGPLSARLRAVRHEGREIEVREGVSHGDMPRVLGEMDVLVLPSLTTPQWAEQFGRILVEAMWCGVPVVGSDSGGIPWVIETTGGGLVFPEGDIGALAGALDQLAGDPQLRRTLAERGSYVAHAQFGTDASADALAALLRHSQRDAPTGQDRQRLEERRARKR